MFTSTTDAVYAEGLAWLAGRCRYEGGKYVSENGSDTYVFSTGDGTASVEHLDTVSSDEIMAAAESCVEMTRLFAAEYGIDVPERALLT